MFCGFNYFFKEELLPYFAGGSVDEYKEPVKVDVFDGLIREAVKLFFHDFGIPSDTYEMK